MNLQLNSIEKAKRAYEDIKILEELNPPYLKNLELSYNKVRFQLLGSATEMGWFYSHALRSWVNSVRIEFEFQDNGEIPAITFLGLLPYHPNVDEGNANLITRICY